MWTIFVISLIFDSILALLWFWEGFKVRSNMAGKYKRRFGMVLAVIIGALVLQPINMLWACVLAGLPAGVGLLFIVGMLLSAMLHKGPWH